MKQEYLQCPNCGQHKLEKHGKKWALSVFGVAGLIGCVITLGVFFFIYLPVLLFIVLFKKENYRCRYCKVLIHESEYQKMINQNSNA